VALPTINVAKVLAKNERELIILTHIKNQSVVFCRDKGSECDGLIF
jgi:hypothetical protein